MLWTDPHFWTALAYIGIPVALEIAVWRMRPLTLPKLGRVVVVLFEAFIFACAIEHLWPNPVTAWIEAAISLATLMIVASHTPFLQESFIKLLPDSYESALRRRCADLMGLGWAKWYVDKTLWMDNVCRRNMGLPVLDHHPGPAERVTYEEWTAQVEDLNEVTKAQDGISKILADGGVSHQLIKYKNGRVIYGGGTARANGYAWMGVNIDVTPLWEEWKKTSEDGVSEIQAMEALRRQAEIDRLQEALSVVRRSQRDSFIAQAQHDDAES